MKRLTKSVLRIVLFYLLFGGLWIAASDWVLELFIKDLHKMTMLQTYKGWLFVAASGVILYLLARREFLLREKAEAALRESRDKYQLLMQSAGDGIVIVDAETGAILEVNRKIEELTGLAASELLGKHHSVLHPASDNERCRALFQNGVNAVSARTGELCVVHCGSRDIPVEISATTIEVGGKKIVQGMFRDVTHRKAAEAALVQEKKRAERYLDVAGVIIRVLDRSGGITLINRKGGEILGYPEKEILGKNWFDTFVPERLREEVRTVFSKLIEGTADAIEYFENPVKTRKGEERTIAWHNTLIRDEEGRVIATLSSGEDVTARKKAEEQARYRLEHLVALHAIDLLISSSLDLRVILEELLDLVTSELRVDAADVLLFDPHTQVLEYAAMRGFRNAAVRNSRLRLGEGAAGAAALEQRSVMIADLSRAGDAFLRGRLLEDEAFAAYSAVPLIAKGQVKGVLETFHRSALTFDEERMNFLEDLAARAAIAIDNAELFKGLQRSNADLVLAYDTTIEGWARALELRDKETEGHTKRAAELTLRIASAMGMAKEELVHVRRGALLHDIGKMSIPDTVLLKTGALTSEEWELMRRHPVYAFDLLAPIAYLRPAIDIPYCHHERWDGTGYPRGLKAEQIPLAARIFALADTWDALNSERRYHAPWSEEKVREHIRSLAGIQFDPRVVEVFLSLKQPLTHDIEEYAKTKDR